MPGISVKEVEKILARGLAPWVARLGLRVEHVDESGMRLRLPYHADLVQGGGVVCGQAMMAAADTAMVLGVTNALGGHEPITTVNQSTNFLRPALGATDIVLKVSVMKTGRQLVVGEVTLYAEGSERALAHVTSTYARLPAKP